MTTPPEPGGTTPDLDALENTTRALIDQHLGGARDEASREARTGPEVLRRNTRLRDRLRQARAAIIDTALDAVRRAVPLGARDAAVEAPPPEGAQTRIVPADADVHDLTADIDLRQDVRFIISSTGLRVETSPPRTTADAVAVVDQAANRVWNVTTTGINRAYNRGRGWYAALFAYDLRWYTRADERVCPVCRPRNGLVVASRERFQAEPDWDAFDGRPPIHFRCRCYTEVVRRPFLGGR